MSKKYRYSPLIEVIYQVRFPTILLVNDVTSPEFIGFWNEIKNNYPDFSEATDDQKEISLTPEGIPATVKVNKIRKFVFISEDKHWKVTLSNAFLSLSTRKYEHWKDFSNRLYELINTFIKNFKPMFFSRIGLRYIDLIQRSRYEMDKVEWKDIIKPCYLGNVANLLDENINSYISEIESVIPEKKIVTKSHIELVNTQNIKTHLNEKALILDTDYFISLKTDLSSLTKITEALHSQTSDFIHNAVENNLEEKMGPY